MTTNQHTQEDTQEDINARLALISKAVAEKLASKQKNAPEEETSEQEQNMLVVSACPLDPMERLLCESCQ
jgi:hypothetical protein